jgi:hypothetical protein
MVEALGEMGWYPVGAGENVTRSEERRGFSRHLVRFRHQNNDRLMIDDSCLEIVLLNSHDGTSSFQLYAGLFRFVCVNGLIISSDIMGRMRCRHTGDAVAQVIEGSHEIVMHLPQIAEQVGAFKKITLSLAAQQVYAEQALSLCWKTQAPITPEAVNAVRRPEDDSASLWHTFQRVQENLIKGGVRGRNRKGRLHITRPIDSVNKNVWLNKALWQLTEKTAADN